MKPNSGQEVRQKLNKKNLRRLNANVIPMPNLTQSVSGNPSQQELNRLLEHYQTRNYDEAEQLARCITEQFPIHNFSWKILGAILAATGRKSEAVNAKKTAVKLSPQDAEAHYNLGITLKELGRLEEAEESYMQAIASKPDFAEAYSNLANTLQDLGRLEEAEASYKRAIALKPDYAEAYSHLGCLMYEKGNVDWALTCFEKAFKFDSNLRINEVRLLALKSRVGCGEAERNGNIHSKIASDLKFDSNQLILNRAVEVELIEKLYEMTSRTLENTKDARFGNGSCSLNFQLFDDESSIIKTVSSDLIRIMSDAVKSKVYVYDSFFNILGAGGGTHPHDHVKGHDSAMGLWKQKYSLVYYLSVGDQDCSEPGVLKLYHPDKNILPCEGMIVIIPATRLHSAIYGGNTDRVMIGVNFYSL